MNRTPIKTYEDIQGWFDFERLYEDILMGVVPESHGYKGYGTFLEIGTWLGKSTAYMAGLMKFFRPKSKLYAIDTFTGDLTTESQVEFVKSCGGTIFPLFWENMKDLGLQDFIVPIQSKSLEAGRLLPEGIKFDFIFLDSEHTFVETISNLEMYWALLEDGGIFAGHDCQRPEVLKALAFFSQHHSLGVYFDGNSSFIMSKPITVGKPTIAVRANYQQIPFTYAA